MSALLYLLLIPTIGALIQGVDLLRVYAGFKILMATYVIVLPFKDKVNILIVHNSRIMRFIKGLLVVLLVPQIIHIFWGVGYHGLYNSYNLRNPSIYLSPQPTMFLASVLLGIILVREKTNVFYRSIYTMSQLLTSSIAGVVAYFVFAVQFMRTGHKYFLTFVVCCFVVTATHLVRNEATKGYLKYTAGDRVKIASNLYESTDYTKIDFSNFGRYSTVAARFSDGRDTDSLISALFANLSFPFFILFSIFNLICLFSLFRQTAEYGILFYILPPALFAVSMILPEVGFAYSMFLFLINDAFYYGKNK